jgi:antitoxin component YwqK of YwqJK toxin-antitoxin module
MFAAVKRGVWILVVLATACSGKIIITETEIKPDVFYHGLSPRPYTGKCIVVFSDTRLVKEEFTYKRGILQGKATAWYKNGHLRRRGSYHQGQISGTWEFWDEQGHKTMEATYRNDVLNGPFVSLYENGMIREKGHYADNRRTGDWERYTETGQRIANGQ